MPKKLTVKEIEQKIADINSKYPMSLDIDPYHPSDQNNLVRYHRLLDERSGKRYLKPLKK